MVKLLTYIFDYLPYENISALKNQINLHKTSSACLSCQIRNLVSASWVSPRLNFTLQLILYGEYSKGNEKWNSQVNTQRVNYSLVQNKFVLVQLPIDGKPSASEESQLSLY